MTTFFDASGRRADALPPWLTILLTRRHGSPILTCRNPFVKTDTPAVLATSLQQARYRYLFLPASLPALSGAPDTPKAVHRCTPLSTAVVELPGRRRIIPYQKSLRWSIICTAVSLTPPSMPLLLLQVSMPGIKARHGTNFPIQTFGQSVGSVATARVGSGRVPSGSKVVYHRIGLAVSGRCQARKYRGLEY